MLVFWTQRWGRPDLHVLQSELCIALALLRPASSTQCSQHCSRSQMSNIHQLALSPKHRPGTRQAGVDSQGLSAVNWTWLMCTLSADSLVSPCRCSWT